MGLLDWAQKKRQRHVMLQEEAEILSRLENVRALFERENLKSRLKAQATQDSRRIAELVDETLRLSEEVRGRLAHMKESGFAAIKESHQWNGPKWSDAISSVRENIDAAFEHRNRMLRRLRIALERAPPGERMAAFVTAMKDVRDLSHLVYDLIDTVLSNRDYKEYEQFVRAVVAPVQRKIREIQASASEVEAEIRELEQAA